METAPKVQSHGSRHWPAFNVADVAICGGAFFLIVDELRSGRR